MLYKLAHRMHDTRHQACMLHAYTRLVQSFRLYMLVYMQAACNTLLLNMIYTYFVCFADPNRAGTVFTLPGHFNNVTGMFGIISK